MHPPESDLIYDWNRVGGAVSPARGKVELDDETLRDGLQSPSVKSPPVEQKLEILHLIEALGIDSADIGLPGAGPHVVRTVTRLAREIADARMKLRPNCAARTVAADIVPIIEISQKVGIPIEVACFIRSFWGQARLHVLRHLQILDEFADLAIEAKILRQLATAVRGRGEPWPGAAWRAEVCAGPVSASRGLRTDIAPHLYCFPTLVSAGPSSIGCKTFPV